MIELTISEITEEEWIINAIGRNLLDRINMLPGKDKGIKVKDLYETFLRFDDKPMITGPSAIIETVNRYCTNGVFNVAFGVPGKWSRITKNDSVPFLDVNSEDYWLVDPSVVMTSAGNDSNNGAGLNSDGNGEKTTTNKGTENDEEKNSSTSKTYSKVTISGRIPLENYAQLFTSFVQTLRNNNLSIEVKFTAKSTNANPLAENSATVKSIKESASQLGLDFIGEE